jgi:hypothetical protein
MSMRQNQGGGGGGAGGGGGSAAHDNTYDALGILGLDHSNEFATDGLPPYQLDQGSYTDSPHPQQFEQAYHTPNDTANTSAAEGNSSSDPVPPAAAESLPWQDDDNAAGAKVGSSDWETIGGSADFQLEDIDQILGTTTDSPGR